MPIVVRYSPVAPAVTLAQNAGNFATGQANQDMGLRQQSADLQVAQFQNQQVAQRQAQDFARQRYDDQQQGDQDNLDFKYAQLEAQNRRAQDGVDARFQLADQRGAQQQELANLHELARNGRLDAQGQQRLAYLTQQNDYNQQRDAARYDFQGQQNDANRASREQLGERGQDLRTGLGYDQIDAADRRAADAQQGRLDAEAYRTSQQDQRRAAERDYRGQTDVNRAQIAELVRQRQILEQRARNGDGTAAQRIYQITGQIDQLNQPRTPQLNIPFQSGAELYQQAGGGGAGAGYDAPAPLDLSQFAQPQQQPAAAAAGQPVPIGSQQEYDALPPNTPYVAPDGSVRVKRQ